MPTSGEEGGMVHAMEMVGAERSRGREGGGGCECCEGGRLSEGEGGEEEEEGGGAHVGGGGGGGGDGDWQVVLVKTELGDTVGSKSKQQWRTAAF